MSGSLSIPNTFATASGTVSLSLLDADFTGVANYVNTREISIGTAAARPAAGVAGRWYYASDTGLLYVDTGSAWTQVGNTGVASSVGAPRVQGLAGANNSGTPTTKYDLSADFIQVRNPTDGTVKVIASTGTLTNDLTVASSANGRDQAGAFSASSFVHFYFIYDGTTTATLASATAPPTGPTLPGAYTHWAYAGAVFFGAASTLTTVYMRGSWMEHQTRRNIATDGQATAETVIDFSSCVSANATRFRTNLSAYNQTNSAHVTLRLVSGQDYDTMNPTAAFVDGARWTQQWPNVSRRFYYLFNTGPGAGAGLYVDLIGYQVPNGDV